MVKPILIKNGRVINPDTGWDEVRDIAVWDGCIVDAREVSPDPSLEIIDASGRVVVPGLIDMHVHFRDPGSADAEDTESGSRAAARGGFTQVVTMGNTRPAMDHPDLIREQIEKAEAAGYVQVLPAGCITMGREGKALADLQGMVEAGAVAFTDDGSTVPSNDIMEKAMRAARSVDRSILDHAEDLSQRRRGVMHEGARSRELGLPGIPASSEYDIVRRNFELARKTGCTVHIQHMSSARSIDILREAAAEGVALTGEATPHHLALCDEDIPSDNALYKMNPPLRSSTDRDALRQAVAEGSIAAFATDHAPHPERVKSGGFVGAAFGIVGLETAVGLTYTTMVDSGLMGLREWVCRWTTGPAGILGIASPSLAVGSPANITIFDLNSSWTVLPEDFISRSRNMPFAGWELKGRAVCTLLKGRVTWALEA